MRKANSEFRKDIKRTIKQVATAAAVTALAVLVPIGATGCSRSGEVLSTTGSSAEGPGSEIRPAQKTDIKEDTKKAVGSAETMVESGRHLYFKFNHTIWSIDKATDKIEKLKAFSNEEINGSFWVYKGGLYYDINTANGEETARQYKLYRMDLETGEEQYLSDLKNQATAIYASEETLYVTGFNMNQITYALKEDGGIDKEKDRQETIYAQIPEGCRELYRGVLPYMVENYGYMPVQNDSCLVIAGKDGSGAREVPEVTNTSSVIFAEGCFFVLFQDGSGNTQGYRYDSDTLEKTKLFESPDNPQLIQYRDGQLYYMTNKVNQTVIEGTQFYKVDAETGDTKKAASITTEPGTLNMYDYNGNFHVTENAIYCQEIKDYGVYIGKTSLASGEEKKLLEPVLSQSPINQLGHIEAERKEYPCSCGEKTAVELYIEKMVFDGDDEATKEMNQIMEEKQQSLLKYGGDRETYLDESWVHSEDFRTVTLTYEIAKINYIDDLLVSIQADGYEYSGGAHGTPFRNHFILNRKTGKQLKLSDIVNNPIEELQSKVGTAFRQLAEKTNFAFESPEDLEHTVSDSISYDSDFYLTPEGIVFYYSPYAIAPYAEGFPEVTIPYNDLDIKPELHPKQ